MSLLESIVLGVIQGLTEFFPISSDGHLALGQYLFGYRQDNLAFSVLLHLGTLAALIVVFRAELKSLAIEFHREFLTLDSPVVLSIKQNSFVPLKQRAPSKLMLFILGTTFFTGIAGLLLEDLVSKATQSMLAAGVGFLITSFFLTLAALKKPGEKKFESFGLKLIVLYSLAQSAALMPGISRSGMTIACILLLGIHRKEAGRLSFVAAIPIIALATIYEARHFFDADLTSLKIMAAGVLASFLSGLIAIKGLLAMIQRLNLMPFAIYTFLIGVYCFYLGALI